MSNDDLLQNFDDSDQFMKVNEYVKLNSKGEGGISLFKKRKKKIAKREEPKEMLKEGQFVTDGGIGRRAKSERKNKTLKSFSLKEIPVLLYQISSTIKSSYNSIITNLSTPYQFDAEITMNKIMLNDRQFLNTLHGRFINQTSISNSFLPSSLLSNSLKFPFKFAMLTIFPPMATMMTFSTNVSSTQSTKSSQLSVTTQIAFSVAQIGR